MSGSGPRGASSEGFTLLEVIVAAAILATSAAAIVAIHVRSAERAVEVRDLLIATGTGRNALEEAFAMAGKSDQESEETEASEESPWSAEGEIPERPSLVIHCWQELPPLDEEQLILTDEFHADVWREGEPFVEFATKRAVFLEELEELEQYEEEPEEEDLEAVE